MTDEKMRKVKGVYGQSMWQMWGINLFGGEAGQVLKIIDGWQKEGKKKQWIATVNPEFVMAAQKDLNFKEMLAKTSLNVVDGVGLAWAREVKLRVVSCQLSVIKPLIKIWFGIVIGLEILFGKYRESLVPGVELMKELVKSYKVHKGRKLKVFFLGGWGNRAERTAQKLKGESSKLKVEWSEGEPEVKNEEVVRKINEFKPDFLFVAYGMKKQEEWIERNLKNLEVGVVMGVGRSFDYLSGDLKRAPNWVRKMGMEWLYSLIKEPKRWRRQLELVRFAKRVIQCGSNGK